MENQKTQPRNSEKERNEEFKKRRKQVYKALYLQQDTNMTRIYAALSYQERLN